MREINLDPILIHPVQHQRLIHQVRNQKGLSLVEALVALGIASIIMLGLTSVLVAQNRETKALTEKIASMDLEKVLISSLSNGNTCNYVLNNPAVLTFNSAALSSGNPQYVTPTLPLYSDVVAGTPGPIVAQVGTQASPYSGSLFINSIRLKIVSGSGSSFLGEWEVGFDSTKTVRSLKPLAITTTLTVDTSIPAAARVTGCMGGSPPQCVTVDSGPNVDSASVSCPAGYPNAVNGACNGNCVPLIRNELSGTTQYCTTIGYNFTIGGDGFCSTSITQRYVTASIKCCK